MEHETLDFPLPRVSFPNAQANADAKAGSGMDTEATTDSNEVEGGGLTSQPVPSAARAGTGKQGGVSTLMADYFAYRAKRGLNSKRLTMLSPEEERVKEREGGSVQQYGGEGGEGEEEGKGEGKEDARMKKVGARAEREWVEKVEKEGEEREGAEEVAQGETIPTFVLHGEPTQSRAHAPFDGNSENMAAAAVEAATGLKAVEDAGTAAAAAAVAAAGVVDEGAAATALVAEGQEKEAVQHMIQDEPIVSLVRNRTNEQPRLHASFDRRSERVAPAVAVAGGAVAEVKTVAQAGAPTATAGLAAAEVAETPTATAEGAMRIVAARASAANGSAAAMVMREGRGGGQRVERIAVDDTVSALVRNGTTEKRHAQVPFNGRSDCGTAVAATTGVTEEMEAVLETGKTMAAAVTSTAEFARKMTTAAKGDVMVSEQEDVMVSEAGVALADKGVAVAAVVERGGEREGVERLVEYRNTPTLVPNEAIKKPRADAPSDGGSVCGVAVTTVAGAGTGAAVATAEKAATVAVVAEVEVVEEGTAAAEEAMATAEAEVTMADERVTATAAVAEAAITAAAAAASTRKAAVMVAETAAATVTAAGKTLVAKEKAATEAREIAAEAGVAAAEARAIAAEARAAVASAAAETAATAVTGATSAREAAMAASAAAIEAMGAAGVAAASKEEAATAARVLAAEARANAAEARTSLAERRAAVAEARASRAEARAAAAETRAAAAEVKATVVEEVSAAGTAAVAVAAAATAAAEAEAVMRVALKETAAAAEVTRKTEKRSLACRMLARMAHRRCNREKFEVFARFRNAIAAEAAERFATAATRVSSREVAVTIADEAAASNQRPATGARAEAAEDVVEVQKVLATARVIGRQTVDQASAAAETVNAASTEEITSAAVAGAVAAAVSAAVSDAVAEAEEKAEAAKAEAVADAVATATAAATAAAARRVHDAELAKREAQQAVVKAEETTAELARRHMIVVDETKASMRAYHRLKLEKQEAVAKKKAAVVAAIDARSREDEGNSQIVWMRTRMAWRRCHEEIPLAAVRMSRRGMWHSCLEELVLAAARMSGRLARRSCLEELVLAAARMSERLAWRACLEELVAAAKARQGLRCGGRSEVVSAQGPARQGCMAGRGMGEKKEKEDESREEDEKEQEEAEEDGEDEEEEEVEEEGKSEQETEEQEAEGNGGAAVRDSRVVSEVRAVGYFYGTDDSVDVTA